MKPLSRGRSRRPHHGLCRVFYSVAADLRPVFHSIGWYSIPVGEESILHPGTFSLQGKKAQNVRSSINRADKSQLSAAWIRVADLPGPAPPAGRQASPCWCSDPARMRLVA